MKQRIVNAVFQFLLFDSVSACTVSLRIEVNNQCFTTLFTKCGSKIYCGS